MRQTIVYRKVLLLAASEVLIETAAASAETHARTLNGTIEVAPLCVLEGKQYPQNDLDANLFIENNFVLLSSDGRHYYLPNLPRDIQLRYFGQRVQIAGKVNGESIIVDTLGIETGGTVKLVWLREGQTI